MYIYVNIYIYICVYIYIYVCMYTYIYNARFAEAVSALQHLRGGTEVEVWGLDFRVQGTTVDVIYQCQFSRLTFGGHVCSGGAGILNLHLAKGFSIENFPQVEIRDIQGEIIEAKSGAYFRKNGFWNQI